LLPLFIDDALSRNFPILLALAACLLLAGCAKTTTVPGTPPAPSAGAAQFVAYADAAVTAAEAAVTLIPGMSAQDQALAQTALGDVGIGITCVYNLAISVDPTVVATAARISACLSSMTIPPQAGPQLTAILKTVFASIQAFATAYAAETPALQTATLAAITPASTGAVAQRAAKLVH
jgi:hypothetical protein